MVIFDKTSAEIADLLHLEEKIIKKLVNLHDIHKKKISNRIFYDINSFEKIFQCSRKIPYEEILADIMNIYRKYQAFKIAMPHGLKGDYGELYSMQKLIKHYPKANVVLLGGSYPKLDIIFNGKKIQVKTYFNTVGLSKKYFRIDEDFEVEFCPDITSKDLPDIDYVLLVQVYLTSDHEINHEKTHINIFNKNDFKLFSKEGCWGAKRGKMTIWNFPNDISESLSMKINASTLKKYIPIKHYNNDKYRTAFRDSREKWDRLKG